MINQERLVKTFLDLVQIDSPSGHEDAIAKEVIQRLKALGAKARRDKVGNVIACFEGKGEPLMVNAHLDTVEPGRGIRPLIKGDVITSDGTTILGADCKVGVSALLEALTSIKEDKKFHVPIDVLLTVEEESSLRGSRELDVHDIRARRGFTFDAGGGANQICLSSPYYHSVDVHITGRAAHAGEEPEKGISAIAIAAQIIAELPLGRLDEQTTANVGLIQGGSVRNAVPETAIFQGEIRSRDEKRLIEVTDRWVAVGEKIKELHPQSVITVKVEREFDGYVFTKEHPLVSLVQKGLKEIGLEAEFVHSGGGTDVNGFHAKGITALGIGAASWESHTAREYTKISEILKITRLAEQLILLA